MDTYYKDRPLITKFTGYEKFSVISITALLALIMIIVFVLTAEIHSYKCYSESAKNMSITLAVISFVAVITCVLTFFR